MSGRNIKYTTVSLSVELMKKINKKIKGTDYISAGDFIRTAIREKLTEE